MINCQAKNEDRQAYIQIANTYRSRPSMILERIACTGRLLRKGGRIELDSDEWMEAHLCEMVCVRVCQPGACVCRHDSDLRECRSRQRMLLLEDEEFYVDQSLTIINKSIY
jgi:hypothetical protein